MSGVLKQFLATITCNLLAFAYGSVCTWASANSATLESDEKTPLPSGKLDISEISLVTSIPCFGAIFATLIYSLSIDRFSRKLLLVSIAIPQILSWLIILFAANAYHLYVARFICGYAGGASLVVIPIFVSEIAEDKVRGTLASMLILSCNAGCLFGFVVPIYFNYIEQIKINMMLPTLFLVLFYFFPETPEYLLKRNQKTLAEKSTNFYRGLKNPPSYEMKQINEQEKTYEKIEQESTSISFSDFCTPAAKKAIKIAMVIGALNQFCGAFSMLNYANDIFKKAGSTLSPEKASVIVCIVQLTANFLAMALVDRAGRKLLMTISAFGTAFGLISMGLYDLYKDNLSEYRWIPIASFSTIILIASMGMLPLTYVILSEIMPKKIKNMVILLALEIMWFLAFILVSFYPTLTDTIGTYNCMFMFATCCILGGIFYLIVLPETKGKSYEEIMQLLAK
ncbi:facilitated trehalose transporter Tret1-like [Contarinia nasturtii]|uniref:facilitated trehalose transporter Tret1-like n=1 Tax=Contarinia nasturtii TaxID=265458 RepID=UPI0012D49F52|nr:facilitated trehalose transporter Tret1-like [Contarinia nasturtii]